MAVKKATTKKVVKKAPAKKSVAKKAPVKKATVKKVAPKKAVAKKVAPKKAVAKKAPVKKAVAKKAPAKKAPVKKAVARKAPVRTSGRPSFDDISLVPEVPTSTRTPRSLTETPARTLPKIERLETQVTNENKKGSRKLISLVLLILLGSGAYALTNKSDAVSNPQPVETTAPVESPSPEESASPMAEVSTEPTATALPTVVSGTVSTSFTYTSTGIRLSWNIKGVDVKSIRVSSAEDKSEFITLTSLNGDLRSLRIIKTDTSGWTRFKVTVTPVDGEPFSSVVGLRGRFEL